MIESAARIAHRVVLVRARDPERGHDGVADELLHRAAVRADAPRGAFEEPVDLAADDLGIGRGDERRGVDDVDEEDGRELPFHPRSVGAGLPVPALRPQVRDYQAIGLPGS